MLSIVMLIYAQIGIATFGGRVSYSNPALVNSSFADANYFANNFNDVGSAMVLEFELLVANNWFVLMDGTVATLPASMRWFGYGFFISFVKTTHETNTCHSMKSV